MKAITERLQRMRFERKRMSQREVAHRAEMSVTRYWEIENGYREPDENDVRALARAFRCPVSEVSGLIAERVAS